MLNTQTLKYGGVQIGQNSEDYELIPFLGNVTLQRAKFSTIDPQANMPIQTFGLRVRNEWTPIVKLQDCV